MFNNVIAAVDEHPGGRDAIALAAELAGEDGRLHLAHIHSAVPSLWTRSSAERDAAVRLRTFREHAMPRRIDALALVADASAHQDLPIDAGRRRRFVRRRGCRSR